MDNFIWMIFLQIQKTLFKKNNFGGLDYIKPDGSGARFYGDGTFRGFLEPNL